MNFIRNGDSVGLRLTYDAETEDHAPIETRYALCLCQSEIGFSQIAEAYGIAHHQLFDSLRLHHGGIGPHQNVELTGLKTANRNIELGSAQDRNDVAYACAECSQPFGSQSHPDHPLPISENGDIGNTIDGSELWNDLVGDTPCQRTERAGPAPDRDLHDGSGVLFRLDDEQILDTIGQAWRYPTDGLAHIVGRIRKIAVGTEFHPEAEIALLPTMT